MVIESVNNAKVKNWNKLKEKKYRDLTGEFLIEGDHLLNEAMIRGVVKETIAIDKLFDFPGIPYYEVNEAIMKKLSNQVSFSKVMAVCKKIDAQEIKGNVCILDNIQDPGNLGAIIRSAVAFNIETIVLSPDTVDLYNEKVIRASEGMLFHLNFVRGDIKEIIKNLKNSGYKIYGTNVENGTNLKEINFEGKTGIIIGNEGRGMKKELESYCDNLINIPISDSCESLNAAIAASIIFYELGR
ncbi:MAG: RNA methyltransferase [Bacilli bacterium]|nr:RNA methyltransferase [Bacilli bacterium]